MSKIKLLDDLTIQKIAAGEVIENPASIVKELVENSIDAGSKNIVIEITKGGKESIRVTDDGIGMSEEDLLLAFKRHSTSKLREINDIYNIMSLGFRGEALASISSVAKVEVLTKTVDKSAGTRALIEDGEIKKLESIGTPIGTTMIIKDLFYNLPVRKKFLKSDMSEGNFINSIVTKLALGNPGVGFKLIRDSKVILNSNSNSDLKNSIYMILGKDMATNLVEVNHIDSYLSLKGYITNNQYYRGNRSYQYLYINGRNIMNFPISKSIENRYKSLIPINKFPGYVLNLEIEPGEVDVNIHPTKQEVKFTNQDRIIGTISNVINEYILDSLSIPKIESKATEISEKEASKNINLYELNMPQDKSKTKLDISNNRVDSNSGREFKQSKYFDSNENSSQNSQKIKIDEINIDSFFQEIGLEKIDENKSNLEEISFISEDENSIEDNKELEFESDQKIDESIMNFDIIGRIFDTYILVENRKTEKILYVDQHAAHERVMYEKYKKEFENESVATQVLMIPEIMELSKSDMEKYKVNEDLFKKLGFEVEIFGDNSIAIRGYPIIFGLPETKSIFIDIFDNLDLDIEHNYELKSNKIMKIACVNAIKSGDRMDELEIEALFESLLKCDVPYTCPHGRPTMIELSKKELEKEFLRIM